MFHTLNRSYINGLTWDNGKVVYALKVDDNEADLEVDLRYCGHTTTTTYYEQCEEQWTFGETPDADIYTYWGDECTHWSETTTTYEECPPEPNDPYAGSGGVNPGGGNGIVIGNKIYTLQDDGILHVNIPQLNTHGATPYAIFSQIITVIEAINEYICQFGYEPIDWNDYFIYLSTLHGNVTYNGCQNVVYDLTKYPYGNNGYVMRTQPMKNEPVGGGRWTFVWANEDIGNAPMLQITFSESCYNSIGPLTEVPGGC